MYNILRQNITKRGKTCDGNLRATFCEWLEKNIDDI